MTLRLPFLIRSPLIAASIWLAGTSIAAAQSANDTNALQSALDVAVEQTGASNGLDPAYELLGIAGSARGQANTDIEKKALKAFQRVVTSAAAASATAETQDAHDAIDQLVDLKIFAAANDVNDVQPALDNALSQIVPKVGASIAAAAMNGPWDQRFEALGDLGDLEAATEQADLPALISLVHEAYEQSIAKAVGDAEQEADPGVRTAHADMLSAIRETRDERVADGRASKFSAVAAQVRDDTMEESNEGSDTQAYGGAADASASVESTCIEIAVPMAGGTQAVASRFPPLASDCRDSGRTALRGRCPLNDLSYVCYESNGRDEQITYVYRGTPEETYLRGTCDAANLVSAEQIPKSGAPFRVSGMTLAIACGWPDAILNN